MLIKFSIIRASTRAGPSPDPSLPGTQTLLSIQESPLPTRFSHELTSSSSPSHSYKIFLGVKEWFQESFETKNCKKFVYQLEI